MKCESQRVSVEYQGKIDEYQTSNSQTGWQEGKNLNISGSIVKATS